MLQVRKRKKKLALRDEKWGYLGGRRIEVGGHVRESMRGRALFYLESRYFCQLHLQLYTQCRHICRKMENEWIDRKIDGGINE